MRNNTLKKKLRAGEACLGSWISLAHPTVAEVMALAGFDWLAIDMEHGIVGLEAVQSLVMAIQTTETTPLVRVPWNEPIIVKQVLETGTMGLIFPQVSSAEAARAAVGAVCYPPKGIRGIGCQRGAGFGMWFDEYLQRADEEFLIVVQIEHIEALKHLDAIAGTQGVDVVFVGANDLSASMGLLGQPRHPDVLRAIDDVLAAARRHGISAGLVAANPEEATRWMEEGFRFVAIGHDVGLLNQICRDVCSKVTKPGLIASSV